jgi:prefoldin subunit 5
MLTTLSDLVQQLTDGITALTTGPASLQSITDAIQQVVDTLRNIDLGFLRESLQQLFIQLLDQLEALNPAQLGQTLDDAFRDRLESIDLDLIVSPGDIDSLDATYQAVLDKLRALDPEQLITEVVQPEYEATVVPIIEAFDLTPTFNALIEFLRSLNEELDGELERVNSAYQGLRAARPSLGAINVNISL